MKKRLAAATIAAALSIGLMVPAASAAGEPSLSCDTGGVTQVKGPVPKDATIVTFTWYAGSDWSGVILPVTWEGGSKRYPTPAGAGSVEVDFHTVSGDLPIRALCLP